MRARHVNLLLVLVGLTLFDQVSAHRAYVMLDNHTDYNWNATAAEYDAAMLRELDYYLEQTMDDEKLDEIYEYFREAETESIDEALAELGEEYFSEEEIRLVRIKFFSELAN